MFIYTAYLDRQIATVWPPHQGLSIFVCLLHNDLLPTCDLEEYGSSSTDCYRHVWSQSDDRTQKNKEEETG